MKTYFFKPSKKKVTILFFVAIMSNLLIFNSVFARIDSFFESTNFYFLFELVTMIFLGLPWFFFYESLVRKGTIQIDENVLKLNTKFHYGFKYAREVYDLNQMKVFKDSVWSYYVFEQEGKKRLKSKIDLLIDSKGAHFKPEVILPL